MLRREFLSSFFGGLAGGLPLVARGDAPEQSSGAGERDTQSAQCKESSFRVEDLLSEIQVLQKERANADGHRSQILYLVHTMRSPLACIHLVTDMMRDRARLDVSDELRRDLEMTARSCQRLAELVNDVFAMDRSWRQAAVDAVDGSSTAR
jgi:signal transduction histidine kinase